MVSGKALSERLAELVLSLKYEDLPPEIVERAKGAVLDQLGCQLLGSTLEWNKIPYRFIRDLGGRPECTIVNYGTKTLVQEAAYVNGVFGQGSELDDYMEKALGHPGSYSVATALALAEKDHVDGKQFIVAVVLGYEIASRLGRLMYPGLFERGFHSQGVIGVFAAAGVAGRLLGLREEELVQALGIAGSHASGTTEYDQSGGEVKRLHTGLAIRGGMESAMLAKYGLTGPRSIFEGKRGICPLFAGQCKIEGFEEASREWGILDQAIKMYPCVATIHPSIDVLAQIIAENHVEAPQVDRIEVYMYKPSITHGATIVEPRDVISAQFSLAYSLAIRLVKGSNDLEDYLDSRLWRDPKVLDMAHRVEVKPDPEATTADKRRASRMRVKLTSGKTLEGYAERARGTPSNPLTKEELCGKFRRLASSALPLSQVEQVITMIDKLEQIRDMNQLVASLVWKY